jgi:hypothetical protein
MNFPECRNMLCQRRHSGSRAEEGEIHILSSGNGFAMIFNVESFLLSCANDPVLEKSDGLRNP